MWRAPLVVEFEFNESRRIKDESKNFTDQKL